MKINARFLLVTFFIVLVLSVSYTLIYYSLATKILRSQHTKALQLSKSSFIYSFTDLQNEASQDFSKLIGKLDGLTDEDLSNLKCDFVFEVIENGLISKNSLKTNSKTDVSSNPKTITGFIDENPSAVINSYQTADNRLIFYGRIITPKILEDIVRKNKADIAFLKNGKPLIISNNSFNKSYLYEITQITEILKKDNSLTEYYLETEEGELYATYFDLFTEMDYLPQSGILVFSLAEELSVFQESMNYIMGVMIVSGIIITIIMVLLVTGKFRRQITYLSYGAEIVSKGNLDHRVTVVSKDEIGKLGIAFNHMLDEIQKRDFVAREYSEFMALINQNPTVKEISEVSIEKIINVTGFSIGAIHRVENDRLIPLASYGVDASKTIDETDFNLYAGVIKKKEKKELFFEKNHPEIKSGMITLKISSLCILPIIYNNNVIAILELASEKPDFHYSKIILNNIIKQFAIGLTNSIAFEQLEHMVTELQTLNENYQNQNKKIVTQNEQLKDLHNQLSEKALELENQKEKAVGLTKVKSQFLANMSHELRTPLNSILGLTELIKKNSTTVPTTKEKLDVVLRNGKKLLLLINNILEFSKAESDNFSVKREIFSLNKMIDDIKDYIIPQITEKNLEYEFINVNKLHYILDSAPEMLEQILLNLLGNAVKFTNFGFIKLSVQKISEKDIQFIVEDSGIGISEEEQNSVFEEFNKASNSIKSNKGGSGLGLAICKRYLQLLNGKIEVQSKLKEGTKFIVTLSDVIKNTETVKEDELQIQTGDALIFSNNDDSVDLYKKYLTANSIELTEVNPENIKLSSINSDVKLILIDLNSCEKSWELLYELKENPSTKEIPVFLFTADFSNHIGYMLAPFDFMLGINNVEELNFNLEKTEKFLAGKIEKVCFVNEESLDLSMISQVMENRKIDMSVRDSSEITPEKVLIDNPDVIFIDLINNYFNGIEIITGLKKDIETRNIPVIFYTNSGVINKYANLLTESVETVARITGYHPLDTLNVIRKRLKINSISGMEEHPVEQKFTAPEIIKENDTIEENKEINSILVVDDDKDTQYTVGEILKDRGFNVIFADNGIECLAELNKNKVDLVLLDIMMPKMDGFETIKNIRKNLDFRGLKVIALTAYAMLDNKEVIEKNGFDDIITKPIITDTLLEKIFESVGRKNV